MNADEDVKDHCCSSLIKEIMECLKVPICSPTILKPLVLISALTCLQQCSGSLYIRKFIIQILANENNFSELVLNSTNKSDANISSTSIYDEKLNYFLPLIIFSVRLFVLFIMAFMIKKIRMRFLYFLSLFLTVITLTVLGVVSGNSILPDTVGSHTIKYIKTALLCIHVFFIQFGVQTLPGLLTDILYPTSCQAMMKGITRAISSLLLIFFVFVFKNLNYSHAFFLMAGILFVSSPFLYLFVPEIRNVGTEMSAEFFLPSQTVFYFVLTENMRRCPTKRKNAQKLWKSAYRKISVHNAFFGDRLRYEREVDVCARTYTTVKFDDAMKDINDVYENTKYAKLNNDRINFVSNILGQENHLENNPYERRILIGRGPVTFVNDVMKKGSLFLFNDVIVLAKCIVSNRRYIGEIYFTLSEVKIVKKEKRISISDASEKSLEIELEDDSLANIWEKYINFWSQYKDEPEEYLGESTNLLITTQTVSYTLQEEVPEHFV